MNWNVATASADSAGASIYRRKSCEYAQVPGMSTNLSLFVVSALIEFV